METIIKKAIEGEWKPKEFIKNYVINIGNKCIILDSPFDDPLFWQALGKACGWEGKDTVIEYSPWVIPMWQYNALRFHEINLTQGWDAAVEWLTNLIKE